VVLERVAGQVVVLVVGVGVLLAQPTLLAAAVGDLALGHGVTVGMVAVLIPVIALGAAAVRGGRASKIRDALWTGLADARTGVLSRGTWPGVVLLSVAALAGYLTLFVVAARAAGSQATPGELLPLLVLALLAMGLPFNIGGWGPREAIIPVAFAAAGFGATQGLTAAVVSAFPAPGCCCCGAPVSRCLLRRPAS
jgi:hypothetical protein